MLRTASLFLISRLKSPMDYASGYYAVYFEGIAVEGLL
jgi:hypothetical protein